MLNVVKHVQIGSDHIRCNKVCQDAALVSNDHDKYAIAIVADGHGGRKYVRSEYGSYYAVECMKDTIDEYMEDFERFSAAIKNDSSFILKKIMEKFLIKWTRAIEAHFCANPLTDTEKDIIGTSYPSKSKVINCYGTTLLAGVVTDSYYYGILVGDGSFVIVEQDGTVRMPISDKYSIANYTSSICSSHALDYMDAVFEEIKPVMLAVSTDGLIKSFNSDSDFADYHLRIAAMLDDMNKAMPSLQKNIKMRSEKGSGDDTSISIIFDSSLIDEKKSLFVNLIKEKAQKSEGIRAQKNKRLEEFLKEQELLKQEQSVSREDNESKTQRFYEEQVKELLKENEMLREEIQRKQIENTAFGSKEDTPQIPTTLTEDKPYETEGISTSNELSVNDENDMIPEDTYRNDIETKDQETVVQDKDVAEIITSENSIVEDVSDNTEEN